MKIIKLLLIFFIFPSLLFAQNTKPLIATDNATQTCNSTRMVFTPGALSCSGSVATVTTGGGSGNVGIGTTGWNAIYSADGDTVTASSALITSGSNIGIGTVTPGSLLDVFGSQRILNSGTLTVAGNVGIGTIVPKAMLHVGPGGDAPGDAGTNLYATNKGTTEMALRDSTNDVELDLIAHSSGQAYITTQSPSHPVKIGAGGSLPLTITSVNVGIGSTAPGALLDVFGSIRALNSGTLYSDSTTYLAASAGNVGIGTLNPGVKLDVKGTNSIAFRVGTNTGANPEIILKSAANQWSFSQEDDFHGGNLLIHAGTGSYATNAMEISTAGNVGIGSAAPGVALDVVGAIRASTGTAGQASCWKADKTLGQCTSVVGVGGACTCS